MALAVAVQKLKANSSRWLGEQGLDFEWQKGYGAFSVSASSVENAKNYIRNQERPHEERTFEAEFLALLEKSKVPHDTRDFLQNECRPTRLYVKLLLTQHSRAGLIKYCRFATERAESLWP